MIDEEKLKNQYLEYENRFHKTIGEIQETLEKIAKIFFQKHKFIAKVDKPRLKSIESCFKKLNRKNISCDSLFTQEEDRLITVLNDFIGVRIICNTIDDVYEIAEIIKKYKKRITLVKEQDFNKDPKTSGYRALHLDIEYDAYWDDEIVKIPIELQIKTHLQHAWSEITHDESYKPENGALKNEWEFKYSKHMSDLLDQLDSMAKTIRDQRIKYISPPKYIDSEIIINQNTLSYKISELKGKEQLTKQEISMCLARLKEVNFENLREVSDLLIDTDTENEIKKFKEELRDNSNVNVFELIYYGALLKKGLRDKFESELSKDSGYVSQRCANCYALLTEEEYNFILDETDADFDFYCEKCRDDYLTNTCLKCGIYTSKELCKNCESELMKY